MKTLYKKTLETIAFSAILVLGAFILYKAGIASHNNCKAKNSSIEGYRYCMNI